MMLNLGGQHRIAPDILRSRYAEREQREASDTRTEAQRWLGDPSPMRITPAPAARRPAPCPSRPALRSFP